MGTSTLTIAVLLPEVLGTYSDTGNATVLARRAGWRGIDVEVLHITAAQTPPTGCDIYLLGGGEDAAQQFAVSWLRSHRALTAAMQDRVLTLAVCAGLQILGVSTVDADGRHHRGAGLLDLITTPARRRAVGEIVTDCALPGVGLLTGFENHRGATTLGTDTSPLGRVLTGTGNGAPGPADGPVDGAVTERIIATYLHGPVLARNPALADHLLHRATGHALPELDLPDQAQLRRSYLVARRDRPARFRLRRR